MLVLGIDCATSCGLAWVDRALQASEWKCLTVECEGKNAEEKAGDLAMFMYEDLGRRRPDFAAIEMPQRSVQQFARKRRDADTGEEVTENTINPNALQLSALAGAVVAALDIRGIPWGLIAPATWRSCYFGKGVKPDGDWFSPYGNAPKPSNWTADWKELAILHAVRQQIPLPSTQKAQRDAAEAVGIACAWSRCTFIPTRHQQAFMALRMGRAAA